VALHTLCQEQCHTTCYCSEENPWNAIPEFARDTVAASVGFAGMRLGLGMRCVYCESISIEKAERERRGEREKSTRWRSIEIFPVIQRVYTCCVRAHSGNCEWGPSFRREKDRDASPFSKYRQ
jgi:hypothetical protein